MDIKGVDNRLFRSKIILNNDQFADVARLLYKQARYNNEYSYKKVGYNYRMANINAALGCAQLEQLAENLSKKRSL